MISPGFHYENSNEADKMDFEKAIETIAVAFSSKLVFVYLDCVKPVLFFKKNL